MRFGLDVAQQRVSFDEVVRRVQFAEELGFDGAWGFDHFQPMYGEGPGEAFEGMTTLAALSGVTSRIRLGLLVTGVTYRHPSVFAAQAVTVDHASHGRLELSFGANFLAKQPSFTDEKPWQSIGGAIRSPIGRRAALQISAAGGHLIGHEGMWTKEALLLEWREPIADILQFDIAGGVDGVPDGAVGTRRRRGERVAGHARRYRCHRRRPP